MLTRLFKNVFAVGSVLAAISLLVYGSFLIRKNSPKIQKTEVRFTPPTFPGGELDKSRAVSSDGSRQLGSSTPVENKSGASSHRDGVERYIGGTGIIEPAGEAINIGAQVPGIVANLFVQPGDRVTKGQVLFVVDDRASRANLKVAEANLTAQKAKLLELQGQIAPQRARVDTTTAQLEQSRASMRNAQQEFLRAKSIVGNGVSVEELELRQLNVQLAEAKVSEAEARNREAMGSLELLAGKSAAPSILVQQAAVEQAQANVEKEEIEVQLRTVVAPRDATVLQVKIRVGEFVPAALLTTPLLTLGVTDPLHVRVDIDESEIPRFDKSAKAFASVRGRPEVKVPLELVRVEPYVVPKRTLNGGVSERVDTRVMQLIYSVAPEIIGAIPGQQVDVYIQEVPH